MSAPDVLDVADDRPDPKRRLGRRMLAAIASCYLMMDPLVTHVWATPGVLTLRPSDTGPTEPSRTSRG